MTKKITACLLLATSTLCANELPPDPCIKSMQDLYKFYYQDIVPKNKTETASEPLSATQMQVLQNIVAELKGSCSPELVAKINHFLQEESKVG